MKRLIQKVAYELQPQREETRRRRKKRTNKMPDGQSVEMLCGELEYLIGKIENILQYDADNVPESIISDINGMVNKIKSSETTHRLLGESFLLNGEYFDESDVERSLHSAWQFFNEARIQLLENAVSYDYVDDENTDEDNKNYIVLQIENGAEAKIPESGGTFGLYCGHLNVPSLAGVVCSVYGENDQFYIVNMNQSINGSLNGELLEKEEAYTIQPGDKLEFNETIINVK